MGQWYRPLAHARDFRQQGIASWYGKDFHGKPTANGEKYNMFGVSAAHKILPLGTYVRVKNLKNGKTIDLKVNDRGPFVAGRVIDLSFGAAKKLGVIGPGTAPVEVIALGRPQNHKQKNTPRTYRPVDYSKGRFTIQVGAFGERENAEKLVQTLTRDYKYTHIKKTFCHRNKKPLYRVLVGKCPSLTQAQEYERALKSKGFQDAFTLAE